MVCALRIAGLVCARELLARILGRAICDIVVQLIERLTCVGKVLRFATTFLSQRLTRVLDRLIHRLSITLRARLARAIECGRRLRRLLAHGLGRLVEPLAYLLAGRAAVLVGGMERREILIEPRHRVDEVSSAVLPTGVLAVVRRLIATLGALLGPAVLLLRQLEGIALRLLSLRLKPSRFVAPRGILRSLAPTIERVLGLVPLLAQLFRRVRRRLSGHARRRLAELVAAVAGAPVVLAARRWAAGRSLDRLGGASERLRALLLGRLARALELVLEAIDLRVEAPLGIFRHRATQRLRLLRDLIRAARLFFFAHRLAHRLTDRRPRHRERQHQRGADRERTEPLWRAQERARNLGLRLERIQHARRLPHLQALERRRILDARELHCARKTIFAIDEPIENPRRIELAQPATSQLNDRAHAADTDRHQHRGHRRDVRDVARDDERKTHRARDRRAGENAVEHDPAMDARANAPERARDHGREERRRRLGLLLLARLRARIALFGLLAHALLPLQTIDPRNGSRLRAE